MITKQMLVEPKIWNMEKDLEKKLRQAIETLSPLFRFQRNGHVLPCAEVVYDIVEMSYNPKLNRVRACKYDSPFSNLQVGEEAGHYLHFKVNPLFGKYSEQEGLELRQLIECVGRFSGLVYADLLGQVRPVRNLPLDKEHSSYELAEHLFNTRNRSFLTRLARMKALDFRKLKSREGIGIK